MIYLTSILAGIALLVSCIVLFMLALEEIHRDSLTIMSHFPFVSLPTMLAIAVIGFMLRWRWVKKGGHDRGTATIYISSALAGIGLVIGCIGLLTLALVKTDIDPRWLMGHYYFISLPAMSVGAVAGFLLRVRQTRRSKD